MYCHLFTQTLPHTDLVSCPPLAPPIDGDVTVRGNVANYSCNPDYALVNGSSNRTCQPNGKWNGSAPICKGDHNYTALSCCD